MDAAVDADGLWRATSGIDRAHLRQVVRWAAFRLSIQRESSSIASRAESEEEHEPVWDGKRAILPWASGLG